MRKFIVIIFNQLNIKNNKIDKDNFEKNHKKNNHVGKHCSNQRCFKGKKIAKLNFQPDQFEKNKFNKDNLKKNHNKKNHVGEHCSNPQYFKEKNYKAKF